ncbi:TetR/AcrR family transcriptional regulator [Pseudomonas sp. NFR16]|uniref:TetR/AcrR family transcriptional regulator n=1 Tax=Pseudomonas sp. NFR16 TaxID=1566248 RepID=UPI0015A71265|nr:TetR/AcrR family transcriptional regulator [Pseudomonas sp. NFR16]
MTEGLKVVHERGFAGASVRDIVRAAGVPQGSFTNHFVSKEAFGLEILDLYCEQTQRLLDRTLLNTALGPLQRVIAYVDAHQSILDNGCMNKGCLYGNFTAESSEHSESIRLRLVAIYQSLTDLIATCLTQAVRTGDPSAERDCQAMALFIVSSLQGAMLLAKAQRHSSALQSLRSVVTSLLH